MQERLRDRLQHAWNAFLSREPTNGLGWSTSYRPDRVRLSIGNEKSIVSSIYNQIALDVSSNLIQHVRLDQNGRYIETMKSGLNDALTLSANADQTGKAFIQDVVLSMFDEGCVAIVPTDTTINPTISNSYDITSLRVGKILEWFPNDVRVRVYNERKGIKEDVTLSKSFVAIIENPLYAVMNEPNSTLQRLISKLNLLDAIDQQSGSGKLDLIIQLPYVIRTQAKKDSAESRRKDIESQLTGSKYGIAYTDGTEKIIQLNRPAENNLMAQITYLTTMVFGQIGFSQTILDGTADEKTLLNYRNRITTPITGALTGEMKRKFLTKTAISQGQSIESFRDPFAFVPMGEMADIADKFTRNEILSSNEVRSSIGYKPSNDPNADTLKNKNIAPGASGAPTEGAPENNPEGGDPELKMADEQEAIMTELLDGLEADIDKMLGGGGNE